jgi:hypothetical protein
VIRIAHQVGRSASSAHSHTSALSTNTSSIMSFSVFERQFRDDKTMTDLSRWHVFESENPDTFFGMYQFWVQKAH